MKSKKMIVLICILAFITVLVVLNSTLFTLQSVSIKWMTTTNELKNISAEDFTSNIKIGENVFLINKNEITNKLEKNYPYLRVVGIETKFPNKLVIHSAERESIFAVKLSDNEYAVVDELGKVLVLSSSSIFAGAELGAKPIKVIFNNISLKDTDFAVGEEIKLDFVKDMLKKLAHTLREADYEPINSKRLFISINVTSIGQDYLVSMQTRNGMSITLEKGDEYTTDKFLLGLEVYNKYHQENVVTGDINVRYSETDGKIYANYSENSGD